MATTKHALTPAMREALAKIVDNGGAWLKRRTGDALERRGLARRWASMYPGSTTARYTPTQAGRRMRKTMREKPPSRLPAGRTWRSLPLAVSDMSDAIPIPSPPIHPPHTHPTTTGGNHNARTTATPGRRHPDRSRSDSRRV